MTLTCLAGFGQIPDRGERNRFFRVNRSMVQIEPVAQAKAPNILRYLKEIVQVMADSDRQSCGVPADRSFRAVQCLQFRALDIHLDEIHATFDQTRGLFVNGSRIDREVPDPGGIEVLLPKNPLYGMLAPHLLVEDLPPSARTATEGGHGDAVIRTHGVFDQRNTIRQSGVQRQVPRIDFKVRRYELEADHPARIPDLAGKKQ